MKHKYEITFEAEFNEPVYDTDTFRNIDLYLKIPRNKILIDNAKYIKFKSLTPTYTFAQLLREIDNSQLLHISTKVGRLSWPQGNYLLIKPDFTIEQITKPHHVICLDLKSAMEASDWYIIGTE